MGVWEQKKKKKKVEVWFDKETDRRGNPPFLQPAFTFRVKTQIWDSLEEHSSDPLLTGHPNDKQG